MKVLILIAGQSKRFWPLEEKTFFPLYGRTLLDIQISRLKEAGIARGDISLVGGEHNLEKAHDLYPDLHIVKQEDLALGMRGALLSALPECGKDPVMILCVNDIIEVGAYQDLLKKSSAGGVQGALLAQRVERYFPGGYLEVEGEKITSVIEKPGEGNEPGDLVNIVAHVHNDAALLLDALHAVNEKTDDGYERALAQLFKKHVYCAVPYDGVWQAVKYPWHLLKLLEILLEGIDEQSIHPTADVHPTAVIDGPVILSEGVKVFPHATVRGPCYIGPHTTIANNALVRDSGVGPHCVVGYSTEVKSSILHSHVWTHMTYIGDSVIGENVSFGAGSVTGNLRLDEGEISSVVAEEKINTGLRKFGAVVGSHCRLGAHVSINPGVKIGSGTFVAGHVLLSEDIPDQSFVVAKDGKIIITKNRTSAPRPESRTEFRQKVEKKAK